MWKCSELAAEALHPGAGLVVQIGYRVVKTISGLAGLESGRGAVYQVNVLEIPDTGVSIAVRIREGSDDTQGSRDFGAGFTVNLIDHVNPEIAGSASHLETPYQDPQRPQRWIDYYGMAGIHDRSVVLNRVWDGRMFAPEPLRVGEIAEPNQVSWDVDSVNRRIRVTANGRERTMRY